MPVDLNLPHLGPDVKFVNGVSGGTVTRTAGTPTGGGDPILTLVYSNPLKSNVERTLDAGDRLDARILAALADKTAEALARDTAVTAFQALQSASNLADAKAALLTLFRYIDSQLEAS